MEADVKSYMPRHQLPGHKIAPKKPKATTRPAALINSALFRLFLRNGE